MIEFSKRLFIVVIIYLVTMSLGFANNVKISTVTLLPKQQIRVEISMENSWRLEDGRKDGAWLFVKYLWKEGSIQKSTPAKLSTNKSDHIPGNPLEVSTVTDGMGIFIYLNSPAQQTINKTELILKLSDAEIPDGVVAIQVHAIEMVYIPEGYFYSGDGNSANSFIKVDKDSSKIAPYKIMSEDAIDVGNKPGNMHINGKYPPSGNIPANFPKGFNSFWLMKYEISQGQYVAFLNTLTKNQQKNRITQSINSPVGTFALSTGGYENRNGIIFASPAGSDYSPRYFACNASNDGIYNEEQDGSDRACNFLNWDDLIAYLDWAGLRPITEFEFEKAGKRPGIIPTPRSFAWGTPYVFDANNVINDGLPSESVTEVANDSTGIASHGYAGPQGSLRCGFAAHENPDQYQSGTSYYGVFELSGNLWELCISTNLEGLNFTATHGDGLLTEDGYSDNNDFFPRISEISTSANYRGGSWLSGIVGNFRDLAISERFYANLPPFLRRNTSGGRGGRSE